MNRQHLTDDLIAAQQLPTDSRGRYDINDASVENLIVRIGSKRKVFMLVARFGGPASQPTRRKLGLFPDEMNTEAARVAAHNWNKKIKGGIDPAIEVAEAARMESLRLRSTFASVMEDYLAYIPGRERNLNAANDIDFIRRNILDPKKNKWLNKPISEVTAADVVSLVKEINHRHPTTALHCFVHIKTFFGWTMHPDISAAIGLDRNPIEYLKAKRLGLRIDARERVFEYEEARAFLMACTATPYPYGPCLRILIETGQRRGLVAGMRWSQLSLARKIWIIPGGKSRRAERGRTSKVDNSHKVPLSNRVVALLLAIRESQPAGHGDFVFSTSNGQRPIDNFGDLRIAKKKTDRNESEIANGRFERLMLEILQTLGVELMDDWIWHDVRRTVRTHLEPITGRTEVAEAAIGHGQTGIVRVYNLHKYRAEIRRGFNTWSEMLRKVEEGTCTIADWEHDDEAFGDGDEP
ncbi:tyrosine-type recombinase/integrase [Rhizobium sp. NLR17b]|uniref:tyrosine-type recombinase/integrase n=1 Tax=Rhizobium sp. NLR17b TaxID=2731114 RepID=UPI001C8285E9|nr:tyrosine-type recombinase/integrase [Rhizobium sp. NLR17b]MBX5272989.1 tyrosine-type recombinase/integrase [Rhizobium sp. NLR17b]